MRGGLGWRPPLWPMGGARSWLVWFVCFCLFLPALPVAAEEAGEPTVVITELHYDPDPASPLLEFVELYNPGGAAVSLAGWALAGGVQFEFPEDASLPPLGYRLVAVDPGWVQATFGVRAWGPLQGRLANEGDEVVLRNSLAQEVDKVAYGAGFPWPVVGYATQQSIQLLNAAADNAHGGAWRAAAPTPAAGFPGAAANLPPLIDQVEHWPQVPTSSTPVTVRARVTDAQGVQGVVLQIQVVLPGGYIRLTDPAYATQWSAYTMQSAGDDLYQVTLPAELVRHRTLLRYRVEATDNAGQRVVAPLAEDPQPNFALFVDDSPVPWAGSINPHAGGSVALFNFARMQPLPVYQLIAAAADVADAQFIPPSALPSGYMGDEYLWQGTFVYDGQVYDHIGFRARGQAYRYGTGKNKWKFNFLPGHPLRARDNRGVLYPVSWDKLNLSSGMQHAQRGYRGEHGLFEALSMRLFALAGVPAPQTHFIHLRVVDAAAEITTNQYEGDFWGLYLAVEEPEGRFLAARNLPDGNLYKMEKWSGTLQNQGDGQPGDGSDLLNFIQSYGQLPDEGWWRAHFNLEGYYRFRAVLEAVHHYDVDQGKNYFYYHSPVDNRWSIWPWDTDLTWANFFGKGNEPFRSRVLAVPAFVLEYQNHLRELRDLLFNPEQIELLVQEAAAWIDTPAEGASMVDADRALWDYNPILLSRYVAPGRARWGQFYLSSPTRDFPGMVAHIKSWASTRMAWIDQFLLTDSQMPATPGLVYSGPANYPADLLTFVPGAYADPQGDGLAGLQWRVAQVLWPGLPGYQPGQPNRYEIEESWVSPVLTQPAAVTLPPGICQPGLTCRVRVRMLDSTGRWSHWSQPLQFVAGAPSRPAVDTLRITEIMYNPPNAGNAIGGELEFIELKNTGAAALDLGNVRLAGAVEYTFPLGTQLAPGSWVVLAADAEQYQKVYHAAPQGEYSGQLNNGGETIELWDAFGRLLVAVTYRDEAGWPLFADGAGPSLTLVDPAGGGDPNAPSSWRASTVPRGSPGVDDPVAVLFNEFAFDPATKNLQAIEFYNPAPHPVDLSGWVISARLTQMPAFGLPVGNVALIPAGTQIPAGGYRSVSLAQLSQPLPFHSGPGTLMVGSTIPGGRSSGYAQVVHLYAPAYAGSMGRVVAQDGGVVYAPQESSLGTANLNPTTAPVVLTKVRLLADGVSPVQWLELTNQSAEPVALSSAQDPEATWWLDGVAFGFPAAFTLPPGGRVLVAVGEPSAACAAAVAPAGWQVTGPLSIPLSEGGGRLRLLAPWQNTTTGQASMLWVDEIVYDGAGRLAATPGATYWQRVAPTALGADRLNWLAAGEPLVAGADPALPSLCSFVAERAPGGEIQVKWSVRALPADQQFTLWRSRTPEFSDAEEVPGPFVRAGEGDLTLLSVVDAAVPQGELYYRLEGVSAGGTTEFARSGLQRPSYSFYLPVVAQP